MNVIPALTADRAESVLHDIAMARARTSPGVPAATPGSEAPSVVAEREANDLLAKGDQARAAAKFSEAEKLRLKESGSGLDAQAAAASPAVDAAVQKSSGEPTGAPLLAAPGAEGTQPTDKPAAAAPDKPVAQPASPAPDQAAAQPASPAPAVRKPAPVPPIKYLEAGARLFNSGNFELAAKYLDAAQMYRDQLQQDEQTTLDAYLKELSQVQASAARGSSTSGNGNGSGNSSPAAPEAASPPSGAAAATTPAAPPVVQTGDATRGGAGELAISADPKQRGRWLLHEAREQIAQSNFDAAEKKVAEVEALDIKWGLFDDTPTKVRNVLNKERPKNDASAAKPVTTKPGDHKTAKAMLREAQAALSNHQYDQAESIAQEVKGWNLSFGLFEDNPDKVAAAARALRKRDKIRTTTPREQASQGVYDVLVQESRQLVKIGKLDEAEVKVRQAQRMNVIPALTADRAESVLHDIAMARARTSPGVPAATPGSEAPSVVAERGANDLLAKGDQARAAAKFSEAEKLRLKESGSGLDAQAVAEPASPAPDKPAASPPVLRRTSPRPSPPVLHRTSPRPSPPVLHRISPRPSPPVLHRISPRPSPPVLHRTSPRPSPPVLHRISPRPSPPVLHRTARGRARQSCTGRARGPARQSCTGRARGRARQSCTGRARGPARQSCISGPKAGTCATDRAISRRRPLPRADRPPPATATATAAATAARLPRRPRARPAARRRRQLRPPRPWCRPAMPPAEARASWPSRLTPSSEAGGCSMRPGSKSLRATSMRPRRRSPKWRPSISSGACSMTRPPRSETF